MAFYKIASIYVDADYLPNNYDPFIIQEIPDYFRILKITHSYKPKYIPNLELVSNMNHMNVNNSSYIPNSWVYKFEYGIGTMILAKDYSSAECFFSHDSVKESQKLLALEPFTHIAMQCKLIQEGNSILHSACVSINEEAFAFSGPSGIGKSTRAAIWVNNLNAEWISGDKPIVNPLLKTVYGAPWDGSDHIYKNIKKPLKAIFKVNRSHDTSIQEMSYLEKYRFLAEQLFIPLWDKQLALKSFESLKQIIKNIPIYSIGCDNTIASMEKLYTLVSKL